MQNYSRQRQLHTIKHGNGDIRKNNLVLHMKCMEVEEKLEEISCEGY